MPLDFLNDGQEPAENLSAPETVETPAEAPSGPARGPDGKFVSPAQPEPVAEPQPAPVASAPAAPSEPASPPPGYVPVSVVQELRKEMRELRQPVHQAPAEPPPSVYDEGYEQWVQQQTHQQITNAKLDLSEDMARAQFGDALVDQARDWALERGRQSPAFGQEVLKQRNPYAYVVKEFQRHQVLDQLQDPSEIEQFKAWKAQQAQAAAQPVAAAPPAASPAPPRSLASAPSAGGVAHVPQGPGQAFDNVFKG
jgi:hypothetical protein